MEEHVSNACFFYPAQVPICLFCFVVITQSALKNIPKLCADLSSREVASQVALWVASLAEAYLGEAFPGPSCEVASQEEAYDLHVPGENFEVKRKGIHCSFNVQTNSLVIS